jgi:hypothetical protein
MANKVQETTAMLDYMLMYRNNIKNNSVRRLDAGFIVGDKVARKYVYPKTGAPTQADYKKAMDEIKEKIKKEK